MAVRTAPASFDDLVEQYDHFITVSIYRISRGAVMAEDLPDLKQAVYTRMWETNYLSKYNPAKGSFSNYLFVLIRSVLANQFAKNTRNPLNMAIGVTETSYLGPHVDGLGKHPDHLLQRDARQTVRLLIETHQDFEDDAFERRQYLQDLIARMEAHAATLKDGAALAQVLRLLYDGHTPGEIAAKIGRTTAKVAQYRRRLQQELAPQFEELAG